MQISEQLHCLIYFLFKPGWQYFVQDATRHLLDGLGRFPPIPGNVHSGIVEHQFKQGQFILSGYSHFVSRQGLITVHGNAVGVHIFIEGLWDSLNLTLAQGFEVPEDLIRQRTDVDSSHFMIAL